MSLRDWFDAMVFMVQVVLVICAIVAVCLGVLWLLWISGIIPEIPQAPNPLDVYEQSYTECQSRETLSDSQCHDIALRAAYPNGDD